MPGSVPIVESPYRSRGSRVRTIKSLARCSCQRLQFQTKFTDTKKISLHLVIVSSISPQDLRKKPPEEALPGLYVDSVITLGEEAMIHADSRSNLEAKVNFGR